jgi:hypothetical protein
MTVGESMDGQSKREIPFLAIGTALIKLPVAFRFFTILSHQARTTRVAHFRPSPIADFLDIIRHVGRFCCKVG